MNVLVVTPFFPCNNIRPYAGLFVGEQVYMLSQMGVRVNVVTFVPWVPRPFSFLKRRWVEFSKIPREYSWRGIEVRAYKYPALPRNLILDISSWVMQKLLRQHIERFRPDLIHVHFAYPTGLAAIRVGNLYDVPVVLTVHGWDIHTVPYIAQRYKNGVIESLNRATQVLAVSEFMKEAVLQLCPTARVMTHYIGRDLSQFRWREKHLLDSVSEHELRNLKGPIILFIGNLLRKKGVLDLLKAFHIIEDTGAFLVYVGDGPLMSEIAHQARILNLEGRVRLLGAKPPESIPKLLMWADVLVMPSYCEGLPLVCLEALACGVPVVATRVGGIPEIVRHMETGLLVPVGDIEALARAIKWVLANKGEVRKLSEAGRRLVEQFHNLETNTKRLSEIYYGLFRTKSSHSYAG